MNPLSFSLTSSPSCSSLLEIKTPTPLSHCIVMAHVLASSQLLTNKHAR
jgi:hypothetical protein